MMLQAIKISQLFGIVPLTFYELELKDSWTGFSLAMCVAVYILFLICTIMRLFDKGGSLCYDLFYVITDSVLFVMTVPVTLLSVWWNRRTLKKCLDFSSVVYKKNKFLPRSDNSWIHLVLALEGTLALSFTLILMVVSNFCLPSTMGSYSAAYCYYFLIDCGFYPIYDYVISAMPSLKWRSGFKTSQELLRTKEEFLHGIQNVKRVQAVFTVTAFFMAICCFAQIVSFSDFYLNYDSADFGTSCFVASALIFNIVRPTAVSIMSQKFKNCVSISNGFTIFLIFLV